MKKVRRILFGAAGSVALILVLVSLSRCQSVRIDPTDRLAVYNPDPWGLVLASRVHDGLVDYVSLAEQNERKLNQFLDVIGRFGPESSPDIFESDEEKLAFYINAYNAIMLRQWLDAGAGESKPNARQVSKTWFFFPLWKIDGHWVSLNTLEQNIIRPRFHDPRAHFALVCGAMGCPPLLDGIFTSDQLDEQLESLGRRWLKEPDGMRLDADGTLHLSSIFSWYEEDFDSMGGLAGMLEQYLDVDDPRRDTAIAEARAGRIQFMAYDWTINAIPPGAKSLESEP